MNPQEFENRVCDAVSSGDNPFHAVLAIRYISHAVNSKGTEREHYLNAANRHLESYREEVS